MLGSAVSGGGLNSSTGGNDRTRSGDSGIQFGSYNAPAGGTPPWMLLALAAVAFIVIFKVVK